MAAKVFSGEETFVQIIFTILMAVWTSLYLFFTLRIPICRHLRHMLEYKQSEMSIKDQTQLKLKVINYALMSFGIMVTALIFLHLIVLTTQHMKPEHPEWIASMISVC